MDLILVEFDSDGVFTRSDCPSGYPGTAAIDLGQSELPKVRMYCGTNSEDLV